MKKKTATPKAAAKSLFRKAGEAIGSLGHEIVEGKEKVAEAVQSAISSLQKEEKILAKKVKKLVKKAAVKKPAAKKSAVKKSAVKKTARKLLKKDTRKPVKKKR